MSRQELSLAGLEMHTGSTMCVVPVGECSDVCRGMAARRPADLGQGLSSAFGSLNYEAVFCLPIDEGTVLGCVLVARGGPNLVSVTRQDTLRAAIAHGATTLVVAHNHPSGFTVPSTADREFTRRLLDAAQLVGLELLDHVIFGPGRWQSLSETTDLWLPQMCP